jgi:hypothetical protein
MKKAGPLAGGNTDHVHIGGQGRAHGKVTAVLESEPREVRSKQIMC